MFEYNILTMTKTKDRNQSIKNKLSDLIKNKKTVIVDDDTDDETTIEPPPSPKPETITETKEPVVTTETKALYDKVSRLEDLVIRMERAQELDRTALAKSNKQQKSRSDMLKEAYLNKILGKYI